MGFIKNINEILGLFNKSETKEISENISQDVPEGQMHFGFSDVVKKEINKSGLEYTQKLINDSEDLENLVKNLKENSLIAFKIHYEYKSLLNPLITGIAFGFNKSIKADKQVFTVEGDDKSETFYIPIAHTTVPAQLLLSDVISALKPIFEDENIKKTTYNYKEEYNVLRAKNINLKGVIFDIMLASYVYDSTRNHDIEFQSLEHLNHAMAEYSPYEKDKSKQISFKDALIQDAQKYACDETAVIFELTKYWQKELSDKECNLLYNIEVPMSKVLADMEYSGVSIDKNYLKELSYSMEESLHEAEEKIYQIAGMRFNINSPRQVGDVLFNKLGLKPGKKRGNKKYSTNAAVLEELAEDYEIADLILQYRKYAKLKSTYTDALPELIDYTDGRIHTTYNQTVAVTGRLSSSNPNLQNIPIRSEEGNKIRKAFVPSDRENGVILSADYSQIELRMLAHITGDVHLTEAFNSGMDVHTAMAAKIFEVPVEEVTKEMRQKAKTVNFGIVYGQSKYGLAQTLGISKDEAGLFIDKYFATYPAVKDYMQGTVLLVEEKGYVETIFGRKRYLSSELRSPNAFIREAAKRAAINQPMQGSAADLLKIAMIDFSKKLEENNLKSKMIMQVHDELVVETNNSELEIVKKHIKESMELNQPLSVPLVIDISAGSAWED